MTTTAELIRKENEAIKKANSASRERIRKFEENEYKRVFKFLKKTDFFKTDFSDSELLEGFNKMIDWKKKCDEKTSSSDPALA